MGIAHSRPMRPPAGRVRAVVSMLLAFLLFAGLMPFLTVASTPTRAEAAGSVPVLLHFKDLAGETVDFSSTTASYVDNGDTLEALVDPDGSLCLEDALSVAVYEHYATFGDRQRDITTECDWHPDEGTLALPGAYRGTIGTVAIVVELEPSHPAYERFVLADLDTSPVELEFQGEQTTLESDIPDILAAEALDEGIVPFSAAFPGTAEKHYRLNPYTRLETFDVDMPRKQEAYGIPSDLVGSYGFGVFFGTSQHWEGGVSQGTNFNDWVLNTEHSSFDAVVDAFLYETIAGRNGADAPFATSRTGTTYRDRYVTTGNEYKDTSYSAGKAPTNRAMAHATCGTAGTSNGYGAVASNPNGDNYIVYKGTYTGSQSQYAGWYKFYYKIDARSAATHQEFQDVVGYLLVEPVNTGSAQVVKTSADTSISNANGNYSLEHAVFAAFADRASAEAAVKLAGESTWGSWQAARDWAAANSAFALVTGADGTSPVVEDIEGGDYYVCELFAPAGFRLNREIKTATVEATGNDEDVCQIAFADEPQRGSIDLLKQSASPEVTVGHPSYSLLGATYGVYTDSACTKLFGELRCELNGDANGYARMNEVPIGSYWVREIKRPLEGFALDTRAYAITVTDQTVTRVNTTAVTDKAKLDPVSLFIQKKDAQSAQNHAQGAASLYDAHFLINYYAAKKATLDEVAALAPTASWVVRTNDEGAFFLDKAERTFTHVNADGTSEEVPYKVSGSEFYHLSTGQVAMPLGTYTIQEVKAPRGYLLDDTVHLRHITDADANTEIVETFDAEQNGDMVTDRVARADLRLTKRADGAAKLAGIPFKVTSKTTGEWHILVTDKNGLASTEATLAHPHSANTNANDEQFRAPDGSFQMPLTLDTEALDATAGTWFGLNAEGEAVPASDSLGALPFDTYEIEELRCPANQLFQMIRDEVVVDESDEGLTIDLGTLNNTATGKPTIRTSAYDGLSNDLYDSEISADTEAVIVDRVTYSGLNPEATYTLQGVLMDKATGEPVYVGEDEEMVTADLEFTPEDYNGYVNVTFAFDASFVNEKTELVVFETLYEEGVEVAAHRDIDDRKQTITVNPIAIGTTAADRLTGTHEGTPADEVTIVDTVSYQGLTPGVEYQLYALLMNKEENTPWLVDNKMVTVEKTFVAEASAGSVEVEITLPGLDLDGASLVVFESLLRDNFELAIHADINDEGQTVTYAYPDLPLPPTGGEEPEENAPAPEPATTVRRLAQTGDDLLVPLCLAGVLAVVGASLIVASYRKRR
ncbi:VaFE repeat-containing surface-anchored protein [uncultured Adlercreutzia sp.]|uniref:VaFE repeat-containing surface-anchored protein n=1 Tax=uncultured Adlercreutzia sp. TaxID=875803 RepID=UPI0026F3B7BF|nr:VaFE repeat-containing surface-anchored protein [uncultured Adlercreutzia sp.]